MNKWCNLRPILVASGLIIISLLVSCGDQTKPVQTGTEQTTEPATKEVPTAEVIALPTKTSAPTPTEFIPTPTPTPEPPSAAKVNGQPITLELFQKELSRYKAAQTALGKDIVVDDDEDKVLNALIEQVLIEQAAAVEGISVSDKALDAEIERLTQSTGSQQSFDEWLEKNQYSLEEFRAILRSQMTAQVMNMRISENLPDTMEQVHAHHIVVGSEETANFVLSQLNLGMDFATLASEYSLDESTRMNGGDLGFFPRDFLFSPEVEEAAFSMEDGEISGVVKSDFGFHIVQTIERDPARPVPPEVMQRLREVAFDRWIKDLWSAATVERSI